AVGRSEIANAALINRSFILLVLLDIAPKPLNSSATQRKRLHAIAHTCDAGERWFWPRRHH
ncbi:MAG: hypothetical protein WB499_19350, partial [Pseudolabrys sp.]